MRDTAWLAGLWKQLLQAARQSAVHDPNLRSVARLNAVPGTECGRPACRNDSMVRGCSTSMPALWLSRLATLFDPDLDVYVDLCLTMLGRLCDERE